MGKHCDWVAVLARRVAAVALYACTLRTAGRLAYASHPMCPLQAPEAGAPSLAFDSDALAADYERLSATRQFESGKRLAADLGIGAGERVLDVGCGTGLLAEYIAGLVGPEGRVLGIDP